ncbi:MAG: CvpA family protein [bacterium]|nr:CvpA family protein [bacterium]
MNLIDYILLGVLFVSTLFGLYRGFIASVLGTGGCLIAFGLSFLLGPKLAAIVQGNVTLQETLSHYTDISSRIGDLDLALSNVYQLTREKIDQIVANVRLPEPFAKLLESNLVNQVYAGADVEQTVQSYLSQTILTACINIICFLVCFAVLLLAISLVVALLKAVFRFPVLKQLDSLAGGAFGLARGCLLCYILMAVAPMVQTMVPVNQLTDLLDTSVLAPLFSGNNLVLAIMNGGL